MSSKDPSGRVVGVGVDLCSVARIGAALERTPGLRERLFTSSEQVALEELRVGRGDAAADSVAAQMFAVKEAVMKSLGVGFDTVPFSAVEVDLRGPTATLHAAGIPRAADMGAESFTVDVELLDGPDGPTAVAEVLALGDARGVRHARRLS